MNAGSTDKWLNELLQRQTPFPADLQEITTALGGASHEALIIIDSKNQVVATLRGDIDEIELPLEIQRAMRRRVSFHPHSSGGGPSITDIVGGIGRGDKGQIIVTPGGVFEVDFGSISELPASQRAAIATKVQRWIDQIMADGKFARWNQDERLDYAIEEAGRKYGFTVKLKRRGR